MIAFANLLLTKLHPACVIARMELRREMGAMICARNGIEPLPKLMSEL